MYWKLFGLMSALFYSIASLVLRKYEYEDKNVTPFQLLFGMSLFTLLLVLVLYITSEKRRSEVNMIIVNKKFIFWIGLYAILFIIGDILYYYGHINTPHVAVLLAVLTGGIMLEVVGSYYLFGEKLKKNSILGISLIVIGILLLENSNKGLKEEMPKKL